jgi:hypothetical protein
VSPARHTDPRRVSAGNSVLARVKPFNHSKEVSKVSKPKIIRRMSVLAVLGVAMMQVPFASAQSGAPTKQQSMDMMKTMDANKDGMVSKDEYMKFYEVKFETMDKNKDKMITQEEWLSIQLKASDGG